MATMRMTIREAVARSGLSATTLRVLDRKGLLTPRRDHANRRIYSPEDIRRARQLAGLPPEEPTP